MATQASTRRVPLSQLSGMLAVAACLSTPAQEATQPRRDGMVEIADRNQVFIDGRFLASKKNVRIAVCPPVKTNEVCVRGRLGGYSSIMEPDGLFRWYHALTKDGTHWRRVSGWTTPEPDDILGARFDGLTVFTDPTADPSSRYKLFDGMRNRIQASSDGSDWRVLHENVFPQAACYPKGMDSHNICFFDNRLRTYVAYVRVNKVYECPPERVPYFRKVGLQKYGAENRYSRRTVGRSVTDDLSKFPMPQVVLAPDERDPVFGGVHVMDFYIPQVIEYPGAQDAYFLFNCRYRSYEDWYLSEDMSQYPLGTLGIYNAGVEDMGLAASRDGINWERYERKPWIRPGLAGSFDSKNMYMSRGMYVNGDEIWMYYIGLDDPHTGSKEALKRCTFSRVVLRKDGFTCVEAEYEGGEFTTPPLRFAGSRLLLNVEASGIGLLRVELQDEGGTPLPGYSLDDCDRVHTANSTSWPVTWRKGEEDVSALAVKAVRLRFELQFGARLYAFRFGE